MISTTLFLLSIANFAPALAAPALQAREYNPDEHLVLGDCGIDASGSNSKSRYMFYYSGAHKDWKTDTWKPPTSRAEVPWDGSYPWRPSGVSAKFENGDIFLVRIEKPGGKDNMLENVGTASHIYDSHPFYCYAHHVPGLTTLPDGQECSSAYVCYHDDEAPTPPKPAPTPEPTLTFKYTAYKEKIELEGKWRAGDIFKWTQFIGDDYCDKERHMTLPDSSFHGTQCTLNVDCGPNRARGMVRAIAKVLDAREDFLNTTTKQIEPACEDIRRVCMNSNTCTEQCMKWGPSEKVVTEVSRHGRGDLVGGDESWKSHVEYTITCPGDEPYDRCDICNGVGGLLSGLGSMISGPLGFAGALLTTGICGSSEC